MMTKFRADLSVVFTSVSALVLPTVVRAQTTANTYGFPDPFAGVCDQVKGPCAGFIIQSIIRAALSLVGAVFFVMFLWGGVTYLTAGGSEESVKKARTTLANAVIGLVIVGLSYAIVAMIANALSAGQTGDATAVPTP